MIEVFEKKSVDMYLEVTFAVQSLRKGGGGGCWLKYYLILSLVWYGFHSFHKASIHTYC